MDLTRAEKQLMKYLWRLEKSFFKELKEQYPNPKPATTTINTLLKRLIDKGFIEYKLFGNSREYHPLVSRNQYFSRHIENLIENHFSNSFEQFASFFTKEVDLSEKNLKKLQSIINNKLKSKQND